MSVFSDLELSGTGVCGLSDPLGVIGPAISVFAVRDDKGISVPDGSVVGEGLYSVSVLAVRACDCASPRAGYRKRRQRRPRRQRRGGESVRLGRIVGLVGWKLHMNRARGSGL